MTTVLQQPAAATREALGPTLIRLREEGLDIVVVDADLGLSTTARAYGDKYPERFFTLGPAEQNMVGIAAGLAAAGKIAFASINEARFDLPNNMALNGELALQRELVAAARGPLVVFDVGANVGDWSRSLFSVASGRDIRLVAFEPSSYTARLLRRSLEHYPNITVEQAAVSDKSGSLELFLAGNAAGINSLHAAALTNAPQGTERVQVTTLDEYCSEHAVEHIDFAKIDTEGNDLFVLRGATRMLGAQRIGLVQFEYTHRWIAARAFLRDVFDLVQPLGYVVGKVTPLGIETYRAWHYELETYHEANYVVMTPEWRDRLPTVRWWND